jgi:hypothetical protein
METKAYMIRFDANVQGNKWIAVRHYLGTDNLDTPLFEIDRITGTLRAAFPQNRDIVLTVRDFDETLDFMKSLEAKPES